jgi:hypothetical protein
MKKLYNFRLETNLVSQVDEIADNRTQFVSDALQNYLQPDLQKVYNVDLSYLQHLESEVTFLRTQMEIQSKRIFLLPEGNNAFGKNVTNIDFKAHPRVVNTPGQKRAQNSARGFKINPQRNVKTNNRSKRAKKGWWARFFGF